MKAVCAVILSFAALAQSACPLSSGFPFLFSQAPLAAPAAKAPWAAPPTFTIPTIETYVPRSPAYALPPTEFALSGPGVISSPFSFSAVLPPPPAVLPPPPAAVLPPAPAVLPQPSFSFSAILPPPPPAFKVPSVLPPPPAFNLPAILPAQSAVIPQQAWNILPPQQFTFLPPPAAPTAFLPEILPAPFKMPGFGNCFSAAGPAAAII